MGFAKRFLLLPLLLLSALSTLEFSTALGFNCSSPARCSALLGYITVNNTNLGAIQSLFNIKDIGNLLGANDLAPSTPRSYNISKNQVIKVPINCVCYNNNGTPSDPPVYKVQPNDGLYHVAAEVFSRLVTYPQIQAFNGIPDPNKIDVGQELKIPLPCSCDDVNGEKVVHYAHVVKGGSSLEEIAREFGTDNVTLARINGISGDAELKADQPIDVPLKACNTSIRPDSLDSSLRAANGTYVVTANGCVRCTCDAANKWTLNCEPSQNKPSKWESCPSMQCEGSSLSLGNSSNATSGCRSTCSYAGFNNATIFTTVVQDCSSLIGTLIIPGNDSYSIQRKELGSTHGGRNCHLSVARGNSLLSPLVAHRNHRFLVFRNKLSPDSGVEDVEERLTLNREDNTSLLSSTENVDVHEATGTSVDVKKELIMLSLPAFAGQAIDPLAQLMETAYIGRLSSVALASAGVSVSVFNIVSKLFNMPLLSVATSFVAEDISKNAIENLSAAESANGKPLDSVAERKQLPSVSTALLLAVLIGIFETLALSLGSGPFLKLMGVPSTSDMYAPAKRFLSLRSLGAPATAVYLALQGIFRGFKDTKTPVFCLGVGNLLAIFFFPLLMYGFGMGVTGAALSTVLSQYIVAFLMIWHLNKRVVLLSPKMGALQFGSYLKSGGFVIGRTVAVLITMTLATSMAARQGLLSMAAHQICMQVWLVVSLLTDALAASGQALIASYLSKGELKTVKEVTNFVLKIGFVTGVSLAAILGVSFGSLSTLFTQDAEVLGIVRTGVLFVSASQPLNALAFIFDGLHYGVSDFPYAACSMMLVGATSSAILLFAPGVLGLQGVWLGLTLFMGLRMTAGFVRILSRTGPWWFLHRDLERAELSVCS
ncbi:hypothetical protein DITRI_Ditri01bG0026800 [Diplodiscus trichospermus]